MTARAWLCTSSINLCINLLFLYTGVDKVQFNEIAVLYRLLDLTLLRQRLRVLVAETLIDRLGKQLF